MSKKREREAKLEVDDVDSDAKAAEDLLFQRVESKPTDKPSSSKRSKSSTKKQAPLAATAAVDNNAGTSTDDVAPSGTDVDSPDDLGRHPDAIAPSSSLRHCNGFDVVRKGSRGRGRQLMVLPGALGLGSGGAGGVGGGAGRLGTLKNVTSTCPVLYVEFPQVRGVSSGTVDTIWYRIPLLP